MTLLELNVAIKEFLPVELALREGSTARHVNRKDSRGFGDGRRRFWKEAEALIDFDSHPNIVFCQDFFRMHVRPRLVMAYGDGQ